MTHRTTDAGASAPLLRTHRRTHTIWFLLGGIALWVFLAIVPLHLLHNDALTATWIVLGAALVPATLFWVMAHRLRSTDTVTAARLVVVAVIGGTLAVSLGGTLDSLVGLVPQAHPFGDDGVVSLALAGFVEEFAKGLLIVVMGWSIAKSTRNGLFVGGSVGLGFAVLETIAYISAKYDGAHPITDAAFVALVRGVTAPVGHVLWSSLLGAALFYAASKTGRFRLSWLVLGAYAAVAALHGLWDGAGSIVEAATGSMGLGGLTQAGATVVVVLLGGLVWRRVARSSPAPAPGL